MKKQVYKPLPTNLEELKARIKREMYELPESLVIMEKGAASVASENGKPFEGKAIRL